MKQIEKSQAFCAYFIWGLLLTLATAADLAADDETAAIEQRLADAVQYLASDELEGRGINTKGLDLAAEYIATQFAEAGLKAELFDGTPMQKFSVTTSAKVGTKNSLAFVGKADEGEPQRLELKLGEDFTPLAVGGSGSIDLPLVFVGYGITGNGENYDDYAGIDVEGKAVVILRHEPQQDDPESVFNGTKQSEHAPFRRKVSNAFEHGAAAIVFCSDQVEIRRSATRAHKRWQEALDKLAQQHAEFKTTEKPDLEQMESQLAGIDELLQQVAAGADKLRATFDPVLSFASGGTGSQHRDFPVVFSRREVVDELLKAGLQTDLATLESEIDDGPKPRSQPLPDWRIVGEVEVERVETEVKNVVAVLEGEGPLAEEVLVIGAHYDHVGRREQGSGEADQDLINNGADDNASGVAAMIEVARTMAQRPQKPRRTVVFIAFAAEERGLLGSGHYVANPLFPVDKTVAMLNMDMVGRLRDEKLTIFGSGTASGFSELLTELNEQHGFNLTQNPSGFGPSDHAAFYGKEVPVMHFFTGVHKDLHKPSDEFDKLNVAGMRRVTAMVTEIAVELAESDQRPEYVSVPRGGVRPSGGERPFFGSVPDFDYSGSGFAISGVSENGPAQKAGLKAGDVIVKLGESKIGNLEDFDSALRKHKAGDKVPVVVRRDDKEQTLEVTLDKPQ